tara:strand:+ start:134 stop:442 length:309 start_codon:yes stop_codon:yes gene_type:complete
MVVIILEILEILVDRVVENKMLLIPQELELNQHKILHGHHKQDLINMEIQVVLEEDQVHIKHQVVEEQVKWVVPHLLLEVQHREDMVATVYQYLVLNIQNLD